jgi:hypothetical protein
MAESRRLSNLGPIRMLMREEPTLRRALAELLRFSHLHNAALFLKIEEAAGVVVIREDLVVGRAVAVRQSTELALGVLFRLLTVFLGPNWRPRSVCFTHSAPKDRAVHGRIFGRRVEFDRDFDGIVCDARDLEVPNPGADPVMARYARQVLEASVGDTPGSTASDVRHLVFVMLPAGHCGIDLVAHHDAPCTGNLRSKAKPSVRSSMVRGVNSPHAMSTMEAGRCPKSRRCWGFPRPARSHAGTGQTFGVSAAQRRSR